MPTSQFGMRLFRFDHFELDLHTGELRKHGVRLRLQDAAAASPWSLCFKHAGDVVTREELRAEIWTADTFVDFDHSLHNAIARLREVLGDSAETPKYIETLPRRGYRFIGEVEEVAPFEPPQRQFSRNGALRTKGSQEEAATSGRLTDLGRPSPKRWPCCPS